ncbi:hypothetical protein JOF56_007114 [Kibdelosporangium banguiense]|uniref:DUF397 domain-containing protein n=1 Tax=Kibdelosporangium banguiense TaxID=1365924 RepID=A0ABS4TQP9_9PSEU|nr:DUF397 domain-containing protein [Kibdelosporangium banguiense]MBP2326729.1 hypothetical protein [Kibdelosporangium banguiense]
MNWRTSSFSGACGNCVQIRQDLAAIRDSKNADGPTLDIDVTGLLATVKSGRLDR